MTEQGQASGRVQSSPMTEHTITVTLDRHPGQYRVDCSCERLSMSLTDFDLGVTIKVHLDAARTGVQP